MQTFFQRCRKKFGKGFTLMLVPNSHGAVKSYTIPASILFIIIIILCVNIYFFVGFMVQAWQLNHFKQILNAKDQKIHRLAKDQKLIKPTLQKSYQITDELNRLKQERAKIMDKWRIIQQKSGRSNYTTNRGISFKIPRYRLSSLKQIKKFPTEAAFLDENLSQLHNYVANERKEQQKLLEGLISFDTKLNHIPSINPVQKAIVSSWFGLRVHPILGDTRFHTGIDLQVNEGTPVMATADGKVVFSGTKSGYGNVVILNHGNGYETYYAHNSKLNVQVGQNVKKGDIISYSGNTGTSTGPHLHYEVRIDDKPVNPSLFLQNGEVNVDVVQKEGKRK